MKNILLSSILAFLPFSLQAQQKVDVTNSPQGSVLTVDGTPFMVNGMNWDYFPIGTNYSYSLWKQPENVIRAALDTEMSLLQNMGVNVIRQYAGVPAKWIQYIYENYGIYTVINHSFGRYGLTINGSWVANTDYANPQTRKVLMQEIKDFVEEYKGTPGVLLYLLGNENNYGLFWKGAETEDIPIEDRESTKQAHHMYKLFDEAALEIKRQDNTRPVALCNGDLLFLDIIAKECRHVDILGINCYRGKSFGDLFQKVKSEYGKPVLFTEFGSDAYNAITKAEAQKEQAEILRDNWLEIYSNASGQGKSGNCIGGFTFQFSDGWWKYKQTENLDVHDANASWSNGGYPFDYIAGEDNMNEEWFGICAKGKADSRGLYELYPRAAYYVLKEIHKINPYSTSENNTTLTQYIHQINTTEAVLHARGNKAALKEESAKIRISELSGEISTYNTGASKTTTPSKRPENPTSYPSFTGFDHMESFYVGVTAAPTDNVQAKVTVNILGNVAENPIDEVFYENRGRSRNILDEQGEVVDLAPLERLKLYNATFHWDSKYLNMNVFFREGHYHWGYEGDFFGLYPEANYGPNMDIYNGAAPFGAEFEGKSFLKGLKVAFGPELWWGANPAVLVKYQRTFGKYQVAGIAHYDITKREDATSSFAIPVPKNTRVSLMGQRNFGRLNVMVGGLWSGVTQVGREFQATIDDSQDATVYLDKVKTKDTFGGKVKLTYTGGKVNGYIQSAIMGLVANGGGDYTQTFTGWKLKDSGSGNQSNVLAGFTYQAGNFQIAPNFLWQKPLVGPMPNGVNAPGRLRNILDDPFAVRSNRETLAGELLLTYDPTPATWMYDWDNDNKEDAPFAASVSFVYRHLPTSQDAAIGIMTDGHTAFAFPGAAPAHDLWETNIKMASRVNHDFGIISSIYFGNAQANGSDQRLIKRFGAEARMIYKKIKANAIVKVNDWGPYDYHRDYNLTFPLQCTLDLSSNLNRPQWFDRLATCIGIRGTFRTLDKYSPRYVAGYVPDAVGNLQPSTDIIGAGYGNEWEIRTYVRFSIF